MASNFEIEKGVTDSFLKCKGIAQFDLIKPFKDPPDIIAKIEDKLFGIEVTAIIIGSKPELIIEKQFEIIFQRVTEGLTNSGIDNLVIRIEPKKNEQIKRDNCVDLIVNLCLDKLDEIGLHRTELADNPIPGIKKITAFRPDESGIVITFDSRSRVFGPLRNNKLKAIIEGKIKKLNNSRQLSPDYHNELHESWLLMTIEGTFYANYSSLNDCQVPIEIENCYDKLFVYHKKKNRIDELSTVYNKHWHQW